ncbi:MAG TPA: SHD1 domain-containing protein, partial [Lacipirellulaceae bacterium]|nr:SHD1 domain-containing protein [Lacipirellulaceae bacterium]
DLAPNSRAPDSGEISISEKDVSIGGGAAGFRTWTSANGKFSADAKLVSFANGIVTIENRDGKQIKVAQDKLSGADREFIDKWRRERRR